MKIAYINFLNHCYVDTEVEMKEIYTSNHMWKLFENFLVDICRVSLKLNVTQRYQAMRSVEAEGTSERPALCLGDNVNTAGSVSGLPPAGRCASRSHIFSSSRFATTPVTESMQTPSWSAM